LQLGRRTIGEAPGLQPVTQRTPKAEETPPVPQENVTPPRAELAPVPDTATPQRGLAPAFVPGGPVPFVPPPFSGPNAFHERLRAKRLARLEQMRRSAEAAGDKQGVQRAEFLEGAVNQLHDQGLFNFGMKVMGAFQSGQLSIDKLKNGGRSPSSSGGSSVEMPDADLGEAAPLKSDALAEPELGESAPLSTDGTVPPANKPAESAPTLPPPSTEK
jgi:hypothetical protein